MTDSIVIEARRAACGLSAVTDIPAADFFRPTRGSSSEAIARHFLYYTLNTNPLRGEDRGAFLNAIADALGRDRSTIGHGVRQIEDLRNEDADPAVIGKRLAFVWPKGDPENRRALIRSAANVVSGVLDVGLDHLKAGRMPDEVLSRQVLSWIARESGLVTGAQVADATGVARQTLSKGAGDLDKLSQDKEKAAVFRHIARLWARALSLRAELRRISENPSPETIPVWLPSPDAIDIWLDEVTAYVADLLDTAESIDAEIRRRIVIEAKAPRSKTNARPIATAQPAAPKAKPRIGEPEDRTRTSLATGDAILRASRVAASYGAGLSGVRPGASTRH